MVDTLVEAKKAFENTFFEFNLSSEELAILYQLYLVSPQTPLSISNKTKIPRTTVYRILSELKSAGFVEKVIKENSTEFRLVSFETIKAKIDKKLSDLNVAKTNIESLQTFRSSNKISNTEVKFYEGIEDLKQLVGNQVHAKKEIVGYTIGTSADLFGAKFSATLLNEIYGRKIKIRELISDNDKYLSTEFVTKYKTEEPYKSFYDWRYIPSDKLLIKHDVFIYNDIVGMHTSENEHYYGVEIKNKQNATLQKQIFETLWAMAQTPEQALKKKQKSK